MSTFRRFLERNSAAVLLLAFMAGTPQACIAQVGTGLRITPPKYGQPFSVDTDEEGQAEAVFKDPLWISFAETLAKEVHPPPTPELLAAACRRSVHMARLTSQDLLIDGCIAEALGRVDPFGWYIDQRRYASAERERRRPSGAMGLELTARKRYGEPLVVVTPIDGGPAARAGMRAGDLIESIDGVSTLPLNQDETIDLLRGHPGSHAKVGVRRGETEIEVLVERHVITPKVVRIGRLGQDVLYARVSVFRTGFTARQLVSGLHAMFYSEPRPKLWILDLRRNSGGPVAEVAAVASLFVPEGQPVLGIASRSGVQIHTSALADVGQAGRILAADLAEVPLVILVDGGTASGAEALANILRKRLGGKVAGEPTAQVDNVLQTFDLRGKAAVQITIGHIVPPSGEREYGGGVPLDAVLSNSPRASFGDPREDGLLAATLELFGK